GADLDSFRDARDHLAERGVDVVDALLVDTGRDPALGDQDRHPRTAPVRTPDRPAQSLRVVLVAHQGRGVGLLELARGVAPVVPRAPRALRSVAKPRVGLDADEVVLPG